MVPWHKISRNSSAQAQSALFKPSSKSKSSQQQPRGAQSFIHYSNISSGLKWYVIFIYMVIQANEPWFCKVFPVTRMVMLCFRTCHHHLTKLTMVLRTGLPTKIDHNLNLPTISTPKIKPL